MVDEAPGSNVVGWWAVQDLNLLRTDFVRASQLCAVLKGAGPLTLPPALRFG